VGVLHIAAKLGGAKGPPGHVGKSTAEKIRVSEFIKQMRPAPKHGSRQSELIVKNVNMKHLPEIAGGKQRPHLIRMLELGIKHSGFTPRDRGVSPQQGDADNIVNI